MYRHNHDQKQENLIDDFLAEYFRSILSAHTQIDIFLDLRYKALFLQN